MIFVARMAGCELRAVKLVSVSCYIGHGTR